jgi:ADP-dependent NAD(P)H-hydrate dehydratase / NAD(P)H-hydrate epimerase
MKLVTVEQMRAIEAEADSKGLHYDELMDRAGYITAQVAKEMLNHLDDPRVTFLIGKGNNGGDGLVAAGYLAQADGFDVRCYLLERLDDADSAPYKAAQEAGLFMVYAEDDDGRVIQHMIASADLVVDALFGIGVRLPLRDTASRILRRTRQVLKTRRNHVPDDSVISLAKPTQMARIATPRVLAVDCPSGLDCDTGDKDTNTLTADQTITFIAPKMGQMTFPGAASVGQLTVATLGVSPEDTDTLNAVTLNAADPFDVRGRLPARPAESNKGTFGKALVLGGSNNYRGAVALSAEAAYRSGTGLVTVATSQTIVDALSSHLIEVTWLALPEKDGHIGDGAVEVIFSHLADYDAILIGPGWGQDIHKNYLLENLLQHNPLPPSVFDADALNILAQHDSWWQKLPPRAILTPHPGEMSRLSQMDVATIQKDRIKIAREKAEQWGAVLVLKGAHTVVADPEGQVTVMPFKSSALATAGTGDILAGLITGLLAQGVAPFDAAVAGTYIHGVAGELAGTHAERAVIAGDVLTHLPDALKAITPH